MRTFFLHINNKYIRLSNLLAGEIGIRRDELPYESATSQPGRSRSE